MPRDYYDILGVSRSADADQIKKAYRRLAKKYHPDVNKDPAAEQKFRELQQAYDVLKDPEKRKLYDQYGHAGVEAGAGGGPGAGGGFGAGGFNPFEGGAGRRRTSNTGPGGFSFRFEEGGESLNDLFETMFGGRRTSTRGPGGMGGPGTMGGMGGHAGPGARPQTRGEDLRHTVTVPFETAARGGTMPLRLAGPNGTQEIDVKIPKATSDGAKLRVRGKGHPSPTGGPAGDLILTVHVQKHPWFERDGLDLHVEVPISIDEAVFGATVEVPTLDGRADLKVPPNTGGGKRLRLRGAGLESPGGQTGDLIVTLRIDIPVNLSDEQRKLFEQLSGTLPDPRRNAPWR